MTEEEEQAMRSVLVLEPGLLRHSRAAFRLEAVKILLGLLVKVELVPFEASSSDTDGIETRWE
jgi:hypothetical protein